MTLYLHDFSPTACKPDSLCNEGIHFLNPQLKICFKDAYDCIEEYSTSYSYPEICCIEQNSIHCDIVLCLENMGIRETIF